MSFIETFKDQLNAKQDQVDEDNLPWMQTLPENNNAANITSKPTNKKIALIGLVVLVIIISLVACFNFFKSKNSVEIAKSEASEVDKNQENSKIQVHIAGEVKNPGVYSLNNGARIIDGINAAGGFTEKADKNSLNLAKTLEDGEQILILSTDTQSSIAGTDTSPQANNGKVNINTADLATLQTLNGVGPSTAQKIIDYRNSNGKFKTIEEVKKISGIGDKTFEKFKDKICV